MNNLKIIDDDSVDVSSMMPALECLAEMTNVGASIMATVSIYEKDTRIAVRTCTFDELVQFCKDKKYKCKLTKYGEDAILGRVKGLHFGVEVSNFGSLHATERDYLNNCLMHLLRTFSGQCGLRRGSFYDIIVHYLWWQKRMSPFNICNKDAFNDLLDTFMAKNSKYQQVTNLNEWDRVPGIYICVNDVFNQVYIGRTNDIKKRVREHWTRNNYFTGWGFDLFNSHDTTRLYARRVGDFDSQCREEIRVISIFKSFAMNFLNGEMSYLLDNNLNIALNDEPTNIVDSMREQHNRVIELRNMLICGDFEQMREINT